jgi:hypothetical protein
VCADANGNFVVAWESGSPLASGQDGSYLGIVGRRFARGGAARGSEFAVNTYTTDYQSFPSVACGDDGRFIIVWSSFGQDGSSSGVFGQRFDSNGQPTGAEFQTNSHTTGTQDYPIVGLDAEGDFVVVWTSDLQDGQGLGVFGQRFASTGAPVGIEFRANSYTSGDQSYPAISVSDAGNFVVTWASTGQDGDNAGIFAQRFTNTALESGSEFRVNTTTAGAQSFPAISMDAAGRFTVVWSSEGQDGDDAGIVARRFASDGTPLGSEFRVNTYTTGAQLFPRVSASEGGGLVVVWTSYGQDGDDAGVFGQRYAIDGRALGTEFQVNQNTQGAQYSSTVTRVSGSDFVVVWATHDGAEGSTDVVGRWFSATTATPTTRPTPPPTATAAQPTSTATMPPTASPTTEPSATPTEVPTDTPTIEPTNTPPPPPSATPTAGKPGDCDLNGSVAVNELVIGVNIALDRVAIDRCWALDRNADGQVSVNELVTAVREVLAT